MGFGGLGKMRWRVCVPKRPGNFLPRSDIVAGSCLGSLGFVVIVKGAERRESLE